MEFRCSPLVSDIGVTRVMKEVTVFGYQKGTESFVKAQLESLTGGEVVQQKVSAGAVKIQSSRHVNHKITSFSSADNSGSIETS